MSSGSSSNLTSWKQRSVRPKGQPLPRVLEAEVSMSSGSSLTSSLETEVSTSSGPLSTSPLGSGGQYVLWDVINLVLWKQRSVCHLDHPLPLLLGNRGQYVLSAMPSSTLASW